MVKARPKAQCANGWTKTPTQMSEASDIMARELNIVGKLSFIFPLI
jgi:hypothetical protein